MEACCTPGRTRTLIEHSVHGFGDRCITILPLTCIKVTPVGLEPTTPSLKVRCSKPAELRSHFSNMSKNQKKTLNFFVVQGFLIYLMIRLHLIKNPELTAILPLNRKPSLAHVNREITYVMC